MVAITVILAAVIGVFVLGLGDELGDSAPSNSISIDVDTDDTDVLISHDSGDSFDTGDITIVAYNDGTSVDSANLDDVITNEGEVSVGDTVTADYNDATPSDIDEIRLIHEPSDSIMASQDVEADNFDDWPDS